MKRQLTAVIGAVALCFAVSGCSITKHLWPLKYIYSGQTTKNTKVVNKAQAKTEIARDSIQSAQDALHDVTSKAESNRVSQGSAFVYGTGQALGHVTNAEPALTLAKELNSLAATALPKPSVADTTTLDNVVRGRLSTNAVENDQSDATVASLRGRLAKTESDFAAATRALNAKISSAEAKYEASLQKERTASSAAASKANLYDEANSMVGSLKLFLQNTWKFIVAAMALLSGLLALWKGGKVAASFYAPPVALGMNQIESLTTKELSSGFSQIIKGGEAFKEALDKSGLAEDAKALVKSLFQQAHTGAQDEKIQTAVKTLTQ